MMGRDDKQPSYYVMNGISPLECFRQGLMSEEEFCGFCKGNVIKYLVRGEYKNPDDCIEDYLKARDYLDELIKIKTFK